MSQYSHLTVDLADENSPLTKIVRLVGRDRLVLDVGCARGHLAEVLRTRGCRVIGVEIDPEDAGLAGQHCEQVVLRDVDEPGWTEELAGRRFDVIVFADVLEHVRDPARVLRQACALLVPETGFIVASIPNVAHVSVRLELLLGSFRREPLGILDATHLHFFTRDTVHELFASCGLAIESWDCTTNELADHLIADYLARARVPYTSALREEFASFNAMAYQFVIAARPTTGPIGLLSPAVEKPIQTMQETIRVFHEMRHRYEETSRMLEEKNMLTRIGGLVLGLLALLLGILSYASSPVLQDPLAFLRHPGDLQWLAGWILLSVALALGMGGYLLKLNLRLVRILCGVAGLILLALALRA